METKEEIQKILNDIPKVENMTSSNGNEIPNQFIIKGKLGKGDFVLFQSYKSPIAMSVFDGRVSKTYIFRDWEYSTTTGKYRNEFLGETKKETLAKLKSGHYVAVDFELD